MLIDRIDNARRPGRTELGAIDLHAGRVLAAPARGPGTSIDAGGRLVAPAFVDAHVHLDKAFVLAEAEIHETPEPTLAAAIASVAAMRSTLTRASVRAKAERAILRLVQQGVTAARAHVEVDPAVGLAYVEMHQELADQWKDRIALQLVAFPQRGLEAAGMPALLDQALSLGLEVAGGCPYVDRDPKHHLDLVFAAAARHGAPVDLHLDFSDDPARSLLTLVAERTRAHGMAGRVTLGHVTTLAAMAVDAQTAALDLLAEAGMALVVLPATDLYLAGHGEPGTRSLAPWERAQSRGVRVAIANNNLNNPFAPFGNGNLLQAAWLAGIARHAGGAVDRTALFDAVTRGPAAILGLPVHGPTAGAEAHFAILDATSVDEAVLQAPAVLASLRAGKLTHRFVGLEAPSFTAARRTAASP